MFPNVGAPFFTTFALSPSANPISSISALSFDAVIMFSSTGALFSSIGALFPSAGALFLGSSTLSSSILQSIYALPLANSLLLSTLFTFFCIL